MRRSPGIFLAAPWAAAAMFLFLPACGCDRSRTPEFDGASGAEGDPVRMALEPIDAEEYAAVLAGHRGKVVLVDFWATWCAPCVAAFPHTVELHRRLADRELVVIAVSLDEPEDADAVRAFLTEQRATFENYHSRYGVGAAAFEAFDLDAVPHLKLYDRDGNLHRVFSGSGAAIAPDEIERVIEELL